MLSPVAATFLTRAGWPPSAAVPFPADWSARSYCRVTRGDAPQRAVLMLTEPDAAYHAFIRVAELLRAQDVLAPALYARDEEHGLLLLEDFGDANLGRLLDAGQEALPLLRRALTALCHIQRRTLNLTAPELPRFDSARFIALLDPLLENFTYADAAVARQALHDVWQEALAPFAAMPQALLLRDFIPDNLMAVPPQHVTPQGALHDIGVLDFELAGIGPLAYDLASLLEEVRRELPDELRAAVIDAYLQAWPELPPELFRAQLQLLSVQRHARTFARLKRMPKPDFYIRTFGFLQRQLQHPACVGVRHWFTTYLPQYFA